MSLKTLEELTNATIIVNVMDIDNVVPQDGVEEELENGIEKY